MAIHTSPRPITKVMQAVINAIPNSWEQKQFFINEIDKIKYKALFMAPEQISQVWTIFCKATQQYVGDENNPEDNYWKEIVSKIIRDEIDYKLWLTGEDNE